MPILLPTMNAYCTHIAKSGVGSGENSVRGEVAFVKKKKKKKLNLASGVPHSMDISFSVV